MFIKPQPPLGMYAQCSCWSPDRSTPHHSSSSRINVKNLFSWVRGWGFLLKVSVQEESDDFDGFETHTERTLHSYQRKATGSWDCCMNSSTRMWQPESITGCSSLTLPAPQGNMDEDIPESYAMERHETPAQRFR